MVELLGAAASALPYDAPLAALAGRVWRAVARRAVRGRHFATAS